VLIWSIESKRRDYEPFALIVIEVSDGLITETATYLDADRLFPLFGLPNGIGAVSPS